MWNMIKGLIRIDLATATEWDEGRTQFIVLRTAQPHPFNRPHLSLGVRFLVTKLRSRRLTRYDFA